MNKDIIIKPKFIVKDYFLVNLNLYAKMPVIWILPLILVYLLVIKDYLEMQSKDYISRPSDDLFPYLQLGVLLLVIAIMIYFVYYSTKRMLTNNPRLIEDIHYILNSDSITEKGESFEMKHFWKDVFKIEEKEKWYLIYLQKTRALVIRKEDFESNEQELAFRTLIESINVKKKLK